MLASTLRHASAPRLRRAARPPACTAPLHLLPSCLLTASMPSSLVVRFGCAVQIWDLGLQVLPLLS